MPTYIVASYAKRCVVYVLIWRGTHLLTSLLRCVRRHRLSWLALHGTPATGLYVCALVYNLLQRHPTCVPMIQRKRKSTAEAAKGNEAFAPPPALSVDDRVIKSSLYELTGLRSHYCPPLASMASVFEKALDKPPYNLEVRVVGVRVARSVCAAHSRSSGSARCLPQTLQEFASHTYSELFEIEAARGLPKQRRGAMDKQVQVATNYRTAPDAVFFGDDTFTGCFQLPQPAAVVLAPLAAPSAGDGDGASSSDSSDSDDDSDDDSNDDSDAAAA